MGAAAMTVLAGGGTQLAGAALTVLTDIATAVGALVMLSTVIFVVLCLVATRGQKDPLTVVFTGDDLGDLEDTVPVPCPWCDSHECLDSTLCNCVEACGSWLCTVKEASRG